MDRVLHHLESLPIGSMLLAAFGVAIIVALFPKKYGVEAGLIATFAWLNLNRFHTLGSIASLSKATYWLPLLAIIYLALVRPGPKLAVPKLAWVYLLVPVLGCLCVLSAADRLYGMVMFCNMFLIAAASISVYRLVDSEQTLKRFLACMFVGLLVPLAIALAALIFLRAKSFLAGQGRFIPFGMPANQFVPILTSIVSLSACGVVAYKSHAVRLIVLCAAGASVALLIATGSRQGVVIMGISLLPLMAWLMRRPLAVIPMAIVLIGVGTWIFGFTEEAKITDRITSFSDTSRRYETALQYLEVVRQRPVAGLLGTRGLSVLRSEDAGHITHNSYLGMLYVGGILLGAPLLVAMIGTLLSMKRALGQSRSLGFQPILLWLLAALLASIYIHGLVNDMIFWSVSSWVFLHYFLSCFFMGLAQRTGAFAHVTWRQYQPA
jgi:hypothetical protein